MKGKSLHSLLMLGGLSYRDMAGELGITHHKVCWYVLEMERRGWIRVERSLAPSLKGNIIRNATNKYISNISRGQHEYR